MGVVSLNQSNTIQNPCNSPLEFQVKLKPVHQDHRSVPVLRDKLSLDIVATVTSQTTASRPHIAFYLPKGAIGRNVVPWNSTTAAQQILGELYFAFLPHRNVTGTALERVPGTLYLLNTIGRRGLWVGREEVDWGKEQRSHLAMNLAWPRVFFILMGVRQKGFCAGSETCWTSVILGKSPNFHGD